MPLSIIDRRRQQLRNVLAPHVKQRANFIIRQLVQMKRRQVTPASCMPLRQLPSLFPELTGNEVGLLVFYILAEGGNMQEYEASGGEQNANNALVAADVQSCLDTIQMANDEKRDALAAFSQLF